ncbi:hypothetical protein THRCLA_22659 [Thraustotheca clavata]|uniref:BRCT domain-containing protein n=1 Tax=Thraustotheca clavata TaxID=74557 RepID=A0A1V9YUZ7_9STRA|nr:hypothetical protein THRCLA_22659 [Thraustotheca clavata]
MPQTFLTYAKISESHYVLVMPQWIFRSILNNARVLLLPEKFSDNPRELFSSIVLYTSNVEAKLVRVIQLLVENYGGQVITSPSRSASHVLCVGPDYEQTIA